MNNFVQRITGNAFKQASRAFASKSNVLGSALPQHVQSTSERDIIANRLDILLEHIDRRQGELKNLGLTDVKDHLLGLKQYFNDDHLISDEDVSAEGKSTNVKLLPTTELRLKGVLSASVQFVLNKQLIGFGPEDITVKIVGKTIVVEAKRVTGPTSLSSTFKFRLPEDAVHLKDLTAFVASSEDNGTASHKCPSELVIEAPFK